MKYPSDILLVEDDRNERDVALRALERAGWGEDAVAIARDGQEALEVLGLEASEDDRETRPRVIFLDLKMPRVDGWEVLERIRQTPHTACVPVVILSSSDHVADVQRSYELGANSFILKHFDSRGPGTYIAEAARYWLEVNESPPARNPS